MELGRACGKEAKLLTVSWRIAGRERDDNVLYIRQVGIIFIIIGE
jgi:hypothetical protein